MDMNDFNEMRNEFEALQQQSMLQGESCVEEDKEDYPDYLKAIYSEVMPPVKSGIYFSRWDLKTMAAELDESFALDVRERMFQKFMQWIATPEDMRRVIERFSAHIDMKSDLYREYAEKYPSTKPMFDAKIAKGEQAKKYFEKVYTEFFT